MFDIVVFVATLVGSAFFKQALSPRTRNVMVPLALAYYLLVIVVIGSIGGTIGLIHFAFTSMNFFPIMIMCDGLNPVERHDNPAWEAFVIFYAYMTLIALTGYLPVSCSMFYLQSFLNTFASGYFVARWVCRTEGGLRKLLHPLIVVAVAAILYYGWHLNLLTGELDISGRMDLSEINDNEHNMNVNGIALRVVALLPFILIAFLNLKGAPIFKSITFVCIILLGTLLVRTGSRNGVLVLLPMAWYFLHSRIRGKINGKNVVMLLLVSIVLATCIFKTTSRTDPIRAFNYSQNLENTVYERNADAVTSGRWSMYEANLRTFSPVAMIFGKGGMLSLFDSKGQRILRFRGANAHSIYMTIFYRSGFVGLTLFLVFLSVFFKQTRKMGFRGNMAKFFMLCYLLTGIGESWGMNGGATAILAGFAIGLISRRPATNSEFGEIPLRYYDYPNRMS